MTIEKHERSTKDLVKAAVSGWLGTALEFMDFQLYSLGAALVFHEIFFPESSTAMALILAMGTYGAGYVARIVGAFIFGKMGGTPDIKWARYEECVMHVRTSHVPRFELEITGDEIKHDFFAVKPVVKTASGEIVTEVDMSEWTKVQTGPTQIILILMAMIL